MKTRNATGFSFCRWLGFVVESCKNESDQQRITHLQQKKEQSYERPLITKTKTEHDLVFMQLNSIVVWSRETSRGALTLADLNPWLTREASPPKEVDA